MHDLKVRALIGRLLERVGKPGVAVEHLGRNAGKRHAGDANRHEDGRNDAKRFKNAHENRAYRLVCLTARARVDIKARRALLTGSNGGLRRLTIGGHGVHIIGECCA